MAGSYAPPLSVPDGMNIFSAQYAREGDDLVIAGEGSPPLTVMGYFADASPAALVAPNGAVLSGDTVALLAGPRAPGQYAQADGPDGAVAIGQVETLSGTSTATRVTGETVELGRGDPVFQGDVIETGGESTLGLRLEDGTLASMSADSRLVLNEFVFESGGSDNWMLVDLVEGAFAFLTGAIAPSGGMEISTPVAVMAIRGTMPVAFVAGEGGASQFFAASEKSYELLHKTTGELLTIISSEAGFSLSSPDAPLETIQIDPDKLDEINGLLDVLNDTAAEADLLGIQTASGFHAYSGFGSIDGNLPSLIDFLLLLEGALAEKAVLEVEDPNQFLMAEATLTASPDQGETDEMSPVEIDVLGNDVHPEGDDLTIVFADVSNGQGTVEIVEGESGQFLRYDPGTDFDYLALSETTDVEITYIVSDSTGATASTTATVTLTGINQAPVIVSAEDSTTVNELADTSGSDFQHVATGNIAFSDVDLIDTHSATAEADGTDYLGSFVLGDVDDQGNVVGWTFTVADAELDSLTKTETRTQTYTVTIDDGNGGTITQDVTITINGANDAPVIVVGDGDSDEANLTEHDGRLEADGTLTVGDVSVSDVVTAEVTGVAASGDHPTEVDNATLEGFLTVNSPVVGSTDAEGELTWAFDSNGEPFNFLADGEELVLVYTITVDDGTTTSSHEVTITIAGTNDAPVISVGTDDSAGDGLTETDGRLTTSGKLSVEDLDISDEVMAEVTEVAATGDHAGQVAGALGFLTLSQAVIGGDATAGTLNWAFDSGTEAFDFLAAGEELVLTYKVTVSDGNGGTDTQDVVVTITGTNDDPTIVAGSTDATGAVTELTDTTGSDTLHTDQGTIAFADLDQSDDHSATVGETPEGYLGTFSLGAVDQATGTVGWTFSVEDSAIDHLADGEKLTQSYTVTLSDGEGGTVEQVVDVTITGSNDVPEVSAALSATAAEDSAGFTVDLLDGASDPDNGETATLRVQNVTGLSAGVTFDGVSTLNVDPSHSAFQSLGVGEKTEITVSYEIIDEQGAIVPQTATITITGTNDDPVARNDSGITDEDTQVEFTAADLLANDTDVDGDDLTIVSVQDAENGTVSMSGDTITFTPDQNYFGPASFTYTVDDGNGGTSTATVNIKVTPVPDVISFALLTIDDPNFNEYTTEDLGSQHVRLFAIEGDGDQTLESGETAYRLSNNINSQGGILNNNDENDPVLITTEGGGSVTFANDHGFGANDNGGSEPTDAYLNNRESITFQLTSGVLAIVAFTVNALGDEAHVVLGFGEQTFDLGMLADGTTVTIDFTGDGSIDLGGSAGLPADFDADAFFAAFAANDGNEITIASGSDGDDDAFAIGDLQLTPYEATGTDPIILDLGAPGVDLSATAAFDLNNDGQTQTLGWTGGEDGMLVMDLDGSGAIESGNEVFSPYFDGGGFADALDALESLDSNGDGVIDARDEAFADLLVWVDANTDGVSQEGELVSLADLGITSLSLDAEGVNYTIDGQSIVAEGEFTYSDGSTGDYVAVELSEISTEPLASGDGGGEIDSSGQLFAVTDLSIHEVIMDYREGDVIDLSQLGFALATGDDVDAFVQYDADTGELSVDVDGADGPAEFEVAAELAMPPPSVMIRITDGHTTSDVEIV